MRELVFDFIKRLFQQEKIEKTIGVAVESIRAPLAPLFSPRGSGPSLSHRASSTAITIRRRALAAGNAGQTPGGSIAIRGSTPCKASCWRGCPGDQGRMGGSDLTSDADRCRKYRSRNPEQSSSPRIPAGRRTLLVLNHESGTGGEAVLKRDILHAAYCPGHVSSVFAFALWSHPIELVRVPGQSVLQLI